MIFNISVFFSRFIRFLTESYLKVWRADLWEPNMKLYFRPWDIIWPTSLEDKTFTKISKLLRVFEENSVHFFLIEILRKTCFQKHPLRKIGFVKKPKSTPNFFSNPYPSWQKFCIHVSKVLSAWIRISKKIGGTFWFFYEGF